MDSSRICWNVLLLTFSSFFLFLFLNKNIQEQLQLKTLEIENIMEGSVGFIGEEVAWTHG